MKKAFQMTSLLCCALAVVGCSTVKEFPDTHDFQSIVSDAKSKVFPAVVYIQSVVSNMESGRDQDQQISGSGVLISPRGEVLTNCHVVDKSRKVRCQLNDGRAYDAKVIGMDKDVDLALLQLELDEKEEDLPFAEISMRESLTEGDFVMALGAPWGMNRSVSIGIVSCASRYLPDGKYNLWIQTDASISPGNSGGPLINTDGKIVGINTLGSNIGGDMGFSVPAPAILDVADRIRKYGKVNWAWFGFQLQPLRDFDRNTYFDFTEGVIVAGTDAGSPARLSGFLPKDRIIAVDGVPVTVKTAEDMPQFQRELGLFAFEEPKTFTIDRGGKTMELVVAPIEKGAVEGDEGACARWGLTAKEINRFDTPQLFFHKNKGVYIYGMSPSGNAGRSRLRTNDIIIEVEGMEITTLEDLHEAYQTALDNIEEKTKAVFTVMRGGKNVRVVVDYSVDYEEE